MKYADLLPNRQSDYVFSWDKMLALNGNTAPYLQYAYTRIKSIFRKGNVATGFQPGPSEEKEVRDSGTLSCAGRNRAGEAFVEFWPDAGSGCREYRPNFLCNYLFELAGKFTAFYENCPVLKADATTRASRLALCDLTARVLKKGLKPLASRPGTDVIARHLILPPLRKRSTRRSW